MAISYTYTPEKLNKWFDLGLTLNGVAELASFGVICKANAEGTLLEFGNHEHGIVKDMPIKEGILSMAKEGVLPIAAKDAVAKKIAAAFSITFKQLSKLPLKKKSAAVWKDLGQHVADDIEAEEQMEGKFFDPTKIKEHFASNAPKVGTISSSEFVKGNLFTEHMASAMLEDVDEEAPSPFADHPVKIDPVSTHFKQADEKLVFPDNDEAMHGPKVSDVFPTDKDKALKMSKVKLSQATVMYQPVRATSDNSTYHLIGIAGKLKFGARWLSNSNLSIRVEGPVAKFKDKLIIAGFNEDYISKGYTSVHFNGVEALIAKRALGAVLMGTGLEFETPLPDLEVISGEGA